MADYDFGELASPATTAAAPATTYDFGELATPAKQAGKPAAPAKPKEKQSLLRQYADVHPGVGAAELGLNLGTGMIAGPVSGLAGLGAAAGQAMGFDVDAADVTRKVGSAMTYDPRTTAGKGVTNAVTKPFQWLAEGGDYLGSKVSEKTGSPLLGAATNTAIQAVPMVVGKVLKKPVASRAAAEIDALEAQKKANLPRDEAVKAAREEGYVLPPEVSGKSGPLSSFFQGVAGSTALDYGSSIKNQRVTNKLVAKELGLPADEPITRKSLSEYREKQGEAYKQVKEAVPELKVTPEFKSALNSTGSKFAKAKAEFPEYFKNPEIDRLVKNLSKDKLSADAAIEMQKVLRNDGYSNLKKFDDPKKIQLGEAQINAAHAIDSLIDQNLAMKAPPGVKNFQSKLSQNLQESRKRIAQSYAVEKALNDATGNVSARDLGKMWEKGQPLSGGLESAAKAAKRFEKQMRDVDKLPGTAKEKISNMDISKALIMKGLDKGTLGAASAVGRMGVKPLLLSDWYQTMMDKSNPYAPSPVLQGANAALGSPYMPLATIPRPPYKPGQEPQ